MELRQLTTENERQIFAECLTKARATRSSGFRESARSHLGRAHLAFGNLYALYECEADPPERMLAGFILHDLGTLPQSYPKPDVSHLPPHSVLEGGELWSLSPGAGRIARYVGAAVAGLLQAKAILLYSIFKPIDLTASYTQLGFVNACEPVKWPYAETLDGSEVWVQPLILEGSRLEAYIRAGYEYLFRVSGERRVLKLNVDFSARPESAPGRTDSIAIATSHVRPIAAPEAGTHHNGNASL
jgi:hypothetical protein